jgi:rhodanese-related sulfurtransferase
LEWKTKPLERRKQLEQASERMKSGVLAEAVGLDFVELHDPASAAQWFRTARGHYVKEDDKLRQDFSLIAMDRTANRKDIAVRTLRDAQLLYRAQPGAEGLKGWLDILDPPPPPPADPTKVSAVKTP